MAAIPSKLSKCKGAIISAAIGDALGWPNEPRSKNRVKTIIESEGFITWVRSTNNPRWHDERILPGEYSDDTQMILSISRCIISGNWQSFFAEKELPFWLEYERGGGTALRRAARCFKERKLPLWKTEKAKDYYSAGGNGAAMRILPHVIASQPKIDQKQLVSEAVLDTIITHGHPRAILGATCYAFALAYLLRKDSVLEYGELVDEVLSGQEIWGAFPITELSIEWINSANRCSGYDFSAVWKQTKEEMVAHLDYLKMALRKGLLLEDSQVLGQLGCFSQMNGAGDVAALAAIFLASRYANNPTLAIKIPAFSFGADTDTIASMTGGLVGMLNGTDWIPIEWATVQDYICLEKIAELLSEKAEKSVIKKAYSITLHDDMWTSTPIGKMKQVGIINCPNGKNGIVRVTKWQTALGQTIYTKSFQPFSVDNNVPLGQQTKKQVTDAANTQRLDYREKSRNSERAINIGVQTNNGSIIKLSLEDILEITSSPNYNANLTIGKILGISKCLLEGETNSATVAKRNRTKKEYVDLVKTILSERV